MPSRSVDAGVGTWSAPFPVEHPLHPQLLQYSLKASDKMIGEVFLALTLFVVGK